MVLQCIAFLSLQVALVAFAFHALGPYQQPGRYRWRLQLGLNSQWCEKHCKYWARRPDVQLIRYLEITWLWDSLLCKNAKFTSSWSWGNPWDIAEVGDFMIFRWSLWILMIFPRCHLQLFRFWWSRSQHHSWTSWQDSDIHRQHLGRHFFGVKFVKSFLLFFVFVSAF